MSYKSRRTLTITITGIILLFAYIIHIVSKDILNSTDISSVAMTMLWFIGISIVVMIVTQIIFHIIYSIGISIKEGGCEDGKIDRVLSSTMIEDEMDKLIELKAGRAGYICAGVGVVLTIVALALDVSVPIALNIMFISFVIGCLIEGIVTMCLYEWGIKNG